MPRRSSIVVVAGRSIEVWDPVTGALQACVRMSPDQEWVSTWELSPSGDWLLWGAKDAGLRVIDLQGRELSRLTLSPDAGSYFSAESPGLATSGGIVYPDGSYEDRSSRLAPYQTACSVAVSPEGDAAIAAYGQAYALVWDLNAGKLKACLGEESPPDRPVRIYRVAWAPFGQRGLTYDSAGQVRLWDLNTGRELLRRHTVSPLPNEGLDRPADMPGPAALAGGLGAIGFAPNGRHVTAADGAVVRRWNLVGGREGASWIGHGDMHPILSEHPGVPRISDVRFSAMGDRALTVGVDATIRVWDVESGKQLWGLVPDPCCMDWADIAPDGRHVVWAACPGLRLYALR